MNHSEAAPWTGNFAEAQFGDRSAKSVEFSKAKFLRSNREFESHLVRPLVCCFCKEKGRKGIIANYPEVSVRIRSRISGAWCIRGRQFHAFGKAGRQLPSLHRIIDDDDVGAERAAEGNGKAPADTRDGRSRKVSTQEAALLAFGAPFPPEPPPEHVGRKEVTCGFKTSSKKRVQSAARRPLLL